MIRQSICLLLACSLTLLSRGQEFADTLQKELDRLHDKKIDTVLLFSVQHLPGMGAEVVKNLGKVMQDDFDLLFYKKNHHLMAEKLLNYFDTLAERDYYSISNDIVIDDNDSLFDWLRGKIQILKKEEMHPFIYKDSASGSTYYELRHVYDVGSTSIGIFTSADHFYKTVSPTFLERYAGPNNQNGAENLNYTLNIHTQLYQLYLRLKQYADKIGYSNDHFVFPRPAPKK